ncbi:MAG: hypothetical protein WCE58_03155 [Gallionella sp.]
MATDIRGQREERSAPEATQARLSVKGRGKLRKEIQVDKELQTLKLYGIKWCESRWGEWFRMSAAAGRLSGRTGLWQFAEKAVGAACWNVRFQLFRIVTFDDAARRHPQ